MVVNIISLVPPIERAAPLAEQLAPHAVPATWFATCRSVGIASSMCLSSNSSQAAFEITFLPDCSALGK